MKQLDDGRLDGIPGIGKSMARDLADLGFGRVSDLIGADPEEMYRRLQEIRGAPIDRCVLYAFRCAVYCAGTDSPHPDLQKWWNWKDRR